MADISLNNQLDEENKLAEKPEKSEKNPEDSLPVASLLASLSGWIAGPVIVSSLIGLYLDKKFGTKPIMILSAVGISFVISVLGLIKESNKMFKRINDAEQEKKERVESKKQLE